MVALICSPAAGSPSARTVSGAARHSRGRVAQLQGLLSQEEETHMTVNSDLRAMQHVLRSAMMTLVAFIVAVMPALAQETTGSLRGRVIDAQGLAVPGVTVTATGPQGAKTAVTDSEGR